MDAIKIDPTAKYVIFVRDADPEWMATVEESLQRWLKSDKMEWGQVFLEKIRVKDGKNDNDQHKRPSQE